MFQSAIIKLTAFCNLNCSYCYMFNLGDRTYLNMPQYLDDTCFEVFIDDVYSYMQQKKLKVFSIVLHGGEPFLWPLISFKKLFKIINSGNTEDHKIKILIQTNGYHINWDLIELLAENNITIGISIDGPRELHDKYRITHNHKPTYEKVKNNVEQLFIKGFSSVVGGFLTVVNPELDPVKYFEWIQELPIKRVDVLWPIEFNYQNTPWAYYEMTEDEYKENPVYGIWFYELFRLWWRKDDPSIFIRFFYQTLNIILGGHKHSDMLVNNQLNMVVLNTDGSIEYHDYFRALRDGNTVTNYNIHNDRLIEIENDLLFQKFFQLEKYLPSMCENCDVKHICGGGFLPGRMDTAIEDFAEKKSILCYDEYYFFHKVNKLIRTLVDVDGRLFPPTFVSPPSMVSSS